MFGGQQEQYKMQKRFFWKKNWAFYTCLWNTVSNLFENILDFFKWWKYIKSKCSGKGA